MFLSKPGEYEPCGMFNFKHLTLLIITITGIFIATKNTKIKEKSDVKKIIRSITIIVWVFEILKIVFHIGIGDGRNFNRIIPLYYCSLLLFSGILSSIEKELFKGQEMFF